jgi:integrase
MPRRLTGTVYKASGKWYARMTIRGQRESILLLTCNDRESAEARTALLSKFAERLREAKREDIVLQLLDHAAALENHKLDDVRRAVDLIVQGKVVRTREGDVPTVRELGERWTSGELAREYPDHIKEKRSAEHDRGRLEMYVYPVIGNIPMDKLTLEHAQLVMRGVPAELASGTRRQVAQLIHRLCAMAAFPMCLRQTNPLPRGFLPKVGPDKAKGWIYPDEEAQLIGSSAVPLEWRMFYGFLHREGTRRSEAGALTWSDIDLDRGVVVLDENKTNDPRAWALSPGVADALRAGAGAAAVIDGADATGASTAISLLSGNWNRLTSESASSRRPVSSERRMRTRGSHVSSMNGSGECVGTHRTHH